MKVEGCKRTLETPFTFLASFCVFCPTSVLHSHNPQRSHRSSEPPFSPTPPQSIRARLKVTEKDLKDLQWEHEVLQQMFGKVRAEGQSLLGG